MTHTLLRRPCFSFLFVLHLLFLFCLPTRVPGAAAEVVEVSAGRLPGSVAPPPVPGPWPHGDSDAADALFFAAEDSAYRRWRAARRRPPPPPPARDASGGRGARERDGAAAGGSPPGGGGSASAAAARTAARRARLKALRNATDAAAAAHEARELLHTDATRLLARLNATTADTGDAAAAAYRDLLRLCLGHTSVFTPDIVIIGEAIPPAESEVRAIAADARSVGDESPETNATLHTVTARLAASRRAHAVVSAFAEPLFAPARTRLATALRDVDARIRANDEATSTARQTQRASAHLRRRLRDADAFVATAARAVHDARRRGSGLLRADRFVSTLTAAARLRGLCANESDLPVEAAELRAAPVEAATGATGEELFGLFVRPSAAGAAVAAAAAWPLRAARVFCVRRARRSGTRGRSCMTRVMLRGIVLAEALMPFVIQALFVTRANAQVEMTLLGIAKMARPAQRLALGAIACAMLGLTVAAASIMGALYMWTFGMDIQQKKKKS